MKQFSEEYRKDNEQIVASDALIRRTKISMKGVVMKNDLIQKKSYLSRGVAAFAVVGVVVCAGLVGSNFINFDSETTTPIKTAQSDNWFNFSVSAAQPQYADSQLELSQEKAPEGFSMMASKNSDSGFLMLGYSFDFAYEGANIADVELSVDKGYFGYYDKNHEFVRLGESYSVGEAKQADSGQFVWMIEYSGAEVVFPEIPAEAYNMTPQEQASLSIDPIIIDGEEEPRTIIIKAVVTFENGEMQERSVVYDLHSGSLVLNER
ncbi:hypothetical protein FWH30_01255 [Microgenomates group bacterium]|nr:hypothetical protein [Microgenomates group bacterium]